MSVIDSSYLVILIRKDIDRFQHNTLFSNEIGAAFSRKNWKSITLDYIEDSKAVFSALRDQNCRFFVTFNGFGTELEMPGVYPGRLEPAFQAFGKPVLDLMHDCPAHESMVHQLSATYPARHLFITDYRYAEMALDLGVKNVTLVASIGFPHALNSIKKSKKRDIGVLFAAGFLTPNYVQDRLDQTTRKGRLYRSIFDEVTEKCGSTWRLDPSAELKQTLRELGITFDATDLDHRFLLSTVVDFVKFDRRHKMLAVINDLPVTLVADRQVEQDKLGKGVTVLHPRSATEILELMTRSTIVLCPTTHMTGFHERPLSAFSAGAAVISSPCAPLEAHFSHGNDILFYSNGTELREFLERLVSERGLAAEIGVAGKAKAMRFFSPDRLVETMLNSVRHLDT